LFEVHDEHARPFLIRSPIADLEDGGTEVIDRFAPVADLLRELAHLNLVALLETFVERGHLYMVFERLAGRTLAVANADGLGPRRSLMIARQILDAMAHGHATGRVHRDLRPSKVLLVPMGGWDLVKVADFGLGMLLDEVVLAFGAGALTGSLPTTVAAYMAPEQVRGRSVDERTDIYALGVMLYEMLAHRLPFPDRDPQLVMRLQLTMPPPALAELAPGAGWLTPEVVSLVTTALHKERDARFGSAQEMIAAVDAAFTSIEHLPPE
jgi:serine/threonine-protein kinase